MMRLVFGVVAMVLASLAFASAGSAEERWKVIARGSDDGDVAVVAVAKRRATKFAVRVRMTGNPKGSARLHTVVTCSKAGYSGIVTVSREQRFTLTGSTLRALLLPIAGPENCGVTAIAISSVHTGRFTVQILVPCVVQVNAKCEA